MTKISELATKSFVNDNDSVMILDSSTVSNENKRVNASVLKQFLAPSYNNYADLCLDGTDRYNISVYSSKNSNSLYMIQSYSDHIEVRKITSSGTTDWTVNYDCTVHDVVTSYLSVEDSGIYVAYYHDNKCYCKRLSADSGTEIWGKDFTSAVYTGKYFPSVTTDNINYVYFSYFGTTGANFVKLSLTNGNIIWNTEFSDANYNYTSVTADSSGLYAAYGFNTNQLKIFKLDTDNHSIIWQKTQINQSPRISQFKIGGDWLYYAQTNNSQLFCNNINKNTGQFGPTYITQNLQQGGYVPFIECDESNVYLAFRYDSKATVKAYKNSDLSVVWTKNLTGDSTFVEIRPIFIGGVLYLFQYETSSTAGLYFRRIIDITKLNVDGLLPKESGVTQIGTSDKYFGDCYAVSWNNVSDSALKENITDIQDAVSKINLMDVKQYNFKGQSKPTYGVIADSNENDPLVINKPDDGYYSVNMYSLLSLTAKAIQDLYKKLKVLEFKLAK